MNILLLDIADLALERVVTSDSGHAHVSADHAHSHAVGEDIEQSRLAGPGGSLIDCTQL